MGSHVGIEHRKEIIIAHLSIASAAARSHAGCLKRSVSFRCLPSTMQRVSSRTPKTTK